VVDAEELIRKKKELLSGGEKVVIKGERDREIEELLRQSLPNFVEVTAYRRDGILTVIIKPIQGYEYKFDLTEPFTYETAEPRSQKEIKEVVEIVLDKFYMNYPKLPIIIDFELLARRTLDRVRAVELFMYLCQRGSPFHCSFLYNYLMDLIGRAEDGILFIEDPSERKYMTMYLEGAGFKMLAKILTTLDVAKLDQRQREMLKDAISSGLREVFSRYAPVYTSPVDLTPGDIKRSWQVADEACKLQPFEWYPVDVDETPILSVLRRVATRIPALAEALQEVGVAVEEVKPAPAPPAPAPTPTVEKPSTEEVLELKRRILEKIRKLQS